MQDIVFSEMYAEQISKHLQQVSFQAHMGGRQQGWNEMIQIVQNILQSNLELNQENIVAHINAMLAEEAKNANQNENAEETPQNNVKPTPTPTRKNHLSLVKH